MVCGKINEVCDSKLSSCIILIQLLPIAIIISGAFLYILGLISVSSYYHAMGFPPELFFSDINMPKVMGMVYGAMGIGYVLVTPFLAFIGWSVGRATWFKKSIVNRIKGNKLILWCIIISSIIIIGLLAGSATLGVVIPPWYRFELWTFIACGFAAVIANTPNYSLGFLEWCIVTYVIISLILGAVVVTSSVSADAGRSSVREISDEWEPRFPTVISRTGETSAPGKIIVCSERLCGFHNGRAPKIVSLDEISEIIP